MISSLKKYKGIDIFVSLARKCPEYSFLLILSASIEEIKKYFLYVNLPDNIQLLPQQTDLLPYYTGASIVLNLTIPDLCVEAFGMTLIEGFCLGTPCIAPDFGGPKELVINGKNGFLMNPYDEKSIIDGINIILKSETDYTKFVENTLKLRDQFSIDSSIKLLINTITLLHTGRNV